MNTFTLVLFIIPIIGVSFGLGISLMEKSKKLKQCTEKNVSNDFYFYNESFLDVAGSFIIVSGIIFAIPFINTPNNPILTWEEILHRLGRACVWETITLFLCFVPILYKKMRFERAHYALKKAFLDGALKYGVNTGHFQNRRIYYKVEQYYLDIEAPSYYMYRWARWGFVDEYILTNVNTGEQTTMSTEHLWRRLQPIVKNNYEVFPWEVNWEQGSFPKTEYKKWIKVGGSKKSICK